MPEKPSTDPAARSPLSGFVLAGGKSTRMGRDKAILPWNHHTLLDHMVQLLSQVSSPVRVVGKSDFPDKIPECGPLGGILTAMETTASPMNLFAAVDLPLLTPEFLRWFCARVAATSRMVVACRIGPDFPLCLGIHRDALPEVATRVREGNLALRRFIRELDAEIVEEMEIVAAGFPVSIFQNLNTPEEWERHKR